MPKPFASLCLTGLTLLSANAALAFSVANLDDVPHKLGIQITSETPLTIEIPAGRTYYSNLPNAKIALVDIPTNKQRLLHARDHDHFAIWKGGVLGIQKRRKPSSAAQF